MWSTGTLLASTTSRPCSASVALTTFTALGFQAEMRIGRLADRSAATGAPSRPMAEVTPAPSGQITLRMPSLRATP